MCKINFQTVSRYCQQIRRALNGFVSDNLGAKRTSRENWLSHNTPQAIEFFAKDDDQFVLIADGTYCYIQKNHGFQRATYSCQKKRNLIKPFLVCATDGTIIDVYGPYEARMNDAKIMEHVLKDDADLRELLKEDDILIADRGFRDCRKSIKKDYNIDVIIPTCKSFKIF